MVSVTVDLPESLHARLSKEAALRQVPVAELITRLLGTQTDDMALSEAEGQALALLQSVSTKPGWAVPARSLWTSWGVRGTAAELSGALEGLMKKGLVTANAGMTAFSLTALGHNFSLQN